MSFTIAELIAKHNELLSYLEVEQAKVDETLKPYREAVEAIRAELGAMLTAQGMQNFKLDDGENKGTAYLQETMNVKIDNPNEFMAFVQQGHGEFLDIGVLKKPVKEWLGANNGTPPPGTSVSFFTKCLIRRS